MKQISARWYEWSRYAPDRRIDEHGHFLAGQDGQPGVIVDPVAFHDGDRDHIAELGGAAAVLLTGPARGDEAKRCAGAFRCPIIAVHEDPEASLPGALMAIPVPLSAQGGLHTPDAPRTTADPCTEVALYHKETTTALLGACALGHPAGSLSLDLPGAAPAPPRGALPVVAAGSPETARHSNTIAARTVRALRSMLSAGRVQTLLVGTGTSLVHEPLLALQDLVYRHDPGAMLLRRDELRWTPSTGMRTVGTRFAVRFADCTRPLGLKTHDFELTEVPPGRQGGRLHRHDGAEELFVILSGRGELLTEHATTPIQAGDVLGFPPRYQLPHAFRNTGEGVLRYLAFGAPSETVDTLDYLETDVRVEVTRYGKRHAFHLPDERNIPYWHGVPTD
jgi:uncharacterized cupin superfamily protein